MNDLNNAANTVAAFDIDGAKNAADDMAQAFERASDRIANALQKAAQTGEFSFSQMAESIARDLARIAVQDLITAPLEGAFQSILSSVGAQSIGQKTTPINVTLKVSGQNSQLDLKKSETQIAAGITRALYQGRKLG